MRRGTEGAVSLELVLGAALLVLPIAVLVLSVPVWVERDSVATVAAQEAARVLVLSGDVQQGVADATALVGRTAANNGLPSESVRVCFAVHIPGPAPDGCGPVVDLPRGAAVTAFVTVTMPALDLPGVGTAVPAFDHTSTHTEVVDHYRSRP